MKKRDSPNFTSAEVGISGAVMWQSANMFLSYKSENGYVTPAL